MTRFAKSFATAACAIVAIAAVPAAATPTLKLDTNARTVGSACARDLTSIQCGRQQDRLLLVEAQRTGKHTDPEAVNDLGRRQLDALVASLG